MKRTALVAARYEKGWSQEEVAERLGITRNTLSKWERGIVAPHPIYVHRLYELFGKNAEELGLFPKTRAKHEAQEVKIELTPKSSEEIDDHHSHHVSTQETEDKSTQRYSAPVSINLLQKLPLDISRYRKNVRVALHLHKTSTAQGLLQNVNAEMQDLKYFAGVASGIDLYHTRELLISNNLLATKIVKDQKQYATALRYTNNALQVAKNLEDGELIATAKYTRGCVKLEWVQSEMPNNVMPQSNREKIQAAIHDFQDVLKVAHSRYVSIHPQLQGFTMLQLCRAESILKAEQSTSSSDIKFLELTDQVEYMVDQDTIDDAYTRLLITGTLSGLHLGGYYLVKAGILNIVGFPDKALLELTRFNSLTEHTYGQDETRNQAWYNITYAEILTKLNEYQEAINTAKKALIACHTINSVQNITTIMHIYNQVAMSSYGQSAETKELGEMLQHWYGDGLKERCFS